MDTTRISIRDRVKSGAGTALTLALPQASFQRCIFVIAHMRCGSTALANVMCSREDVSGYGESHVRYNTRNAVGRLILNQALRKAWKPRARYLFDKILHNRHDAHDLAAFFEARAVFVVRRPLPTIRSIRGLYEKLGRVDEYQDDEAAAQYYLERVHGMMTLWARFPSDRRVGITHEHLIQDPDGCLARVSAGLSLHPPLQNAYQSYRASRSGGGGDPLVSGTLNRIEPRARPETDPTLDIRPETRQAIEQAYEDCIALISTD